MIAPLAVRIGVRFRWSHRCSKGGIVLKTQWVSSARSPARRWPARVGLPPGRSSGTQAQLIKTQNHQAGTEQSEIRRLRRRRQDADHVVAADFGIEVYVHRLHIRGQDDLVIVFEAP